MSPAIIQILITIIGSGAFFSFIQFLIQRHDNREDKMEEMVNKFEVGLKTQQDWGFKHYGEHNESIQKLNEAILQLTKNDIKQNQYMENIGNSLIGLSHDKIISLSDKYLERGGITLKEKTTIKSIYEPYKKLGGNGDCEVAYGYVDQLPIISEEKAKKIDKEMGII